MNKKAEFFSYVIPSVLAFALSGIYGIVDGFFIGNSIGDSGLAAINIAWPVTALLQAVGTGIGMGGAVCYSLNHAPSKKTVQKEYFNLTIFLLFFSGILVMGLLMATSQPILIAFGASDLLLDMGLSYLHIIILGAVLQIFSTGFIPLIRNMGGSVIAMIAMIAGFLTNIVLDYLFVWVLPYGLGGAAAATVIGQGVTVVLCVAYFIKKQTGFSLPSRETVKAHTWPVLRIAVSPFGLTFSPNLIVILMNKFAMVYVGESAVACYATIAYITMIILLLLQGVGDGCQPLISRYHGEGSSADVKNTRQMAYSTALALAVICMVSLFLLRNSAAVLFGASEETQQEVAAALPYFIAGFLCLAFVKVTTSGFYATEKNGLAYILVYAEPILLLVILLFLPRFFGTTGLWAAAPLSQSLTAFIALGTLKLSRPEESAAA